MKKLLAAAGVRVLIEHRDKPGIICLIAIADVCRDHPLAIPGNDFEIGVQCAGGLNGVRLCRVLYGCVVKLIRSASLYAVAAGD